MKVRLKDIAEATGFSVNTVSHALRDAPDISEATKQRIRHALAAYPSREYTKSEDRAP